MNLTKNLQLSYILRKMPRINMSRPHPFTADEAAARLKELIDVVKVDLARYVDKITWAPNGRSVDVKGPLFKGRFEVDSSALNIVLDISVLAALFAEKIRTRIESTLNENFVAGTPARSSQNSQTHSSG